VRLSWIALLPVGLFAALTGFFLAANLRPVETRDALPSAIAGSAAPALTVTQLPGKPAFDLATLADGEAKLVNFWASWCVPCRAEHPQLELLAREVPVYGVNYKDEPRDALAFLDELGDPFAAHMADATGRTGLDWGLYGVPETFVIAGDGTVVLRFAGPITQSVVEDTIRPALDEARGLGAGG
jgi:cytochrome c biogenesis protein CcmG/thiol:disulfide interchange protein DsbE